MLAADGYVLPQQGKGMRVIRNISDEKSRGGGGLETFKEIAVNRGFELKTVTTVFELLICSKALSQDYRVSPKAVSSHAPNASVMQTDKPCAPTTPIT